MFHIFKQSRAKVDPNALANRAQLVLLDYEEAKHAFSLNPTVEGADQLNAKRKLFEQLDAMLRELRGPGIDMTVHVTKSTP